MESLSFGKINLTRIGKQPGSVKRMPRHSGGISRHASPKVLPAKGPEATLQSVPVSQASPIGSGRFNFSGYNGVSERAPQMRGTKVGAMRKGSGVSGQPLTFQVAASARAKNRLRRRKPSSMRSID